MEKFTVAGGTALRYSDVGAGDKTVVLLHGYLESLDVWEDFTQLLRDDFRVVAIDIPGHGISQVKGPVHTMEFVADTLHALLQKIGIEKCYLVGHSMGGYAALAFLKKYPEAAAGLVLFHSTPYADSPEKKLDRDREIGMVAAGKKELLANMNAAKRFAPDNRKKFADEIESLSDYVALTEDEGIVALLGGMRDREDTSRVLKESGVPTLFIFGEKDEHIPMDVARKLASDFPLAEVVWLKNSGHMGLVEEPEASAAAIADFVKRH